MKLNVPLFHCFICEYDILYINFVNNLCPFLSGFYSKNVIIEFLYISEIRLFLIRIILISRLRISLIKNNIKNRLKLL
jgi:hypothetical protein